MSRENIDLERLQPPYHTETLECLKRKELQFLCKRHDIFAKNVELIEKLSQIGADNGDSLQPGRFGRERIERRLRETVDHTEKTLEEIKDNPMLVEGVDECAVSQVEAISDCPVSQIDNINTNQAVKEEARAVITDSTLSPKLLNAAEGVCAPTTTTKIPSKSTIPMSNIRTMSTVPTGKGAPAPAPANGIPLKHAKNPAVQTKKKFDLKESLERPLTYAPYRGPLKPFTIQ